jgi:D-alanyl-D-alanine carboxypeptidase
MIGFVRKVAVSAPIALLLASTISCSDDGIRSAPSTTVVSVPPDTASGPTAPSPGYAATLRERIEQQMAEDGTPGAVVVIRSEERGDWSAAFGTRQVGVDDPVTVDDVFRIGDVTAVMTATVLLRLHEQGKLSLNDPVSRYVDGVPGGDEITLRHLVDFEGGLIDYQQVPAFQKAYAADPQRVFDPQELLDLAFSVEQLPIDFEAWSRTNWIVLGLVIEKVTGKPAADVFADELFEPLELEHIGLADPSGSLPEPHASGYVLAPDAFGDLVLAGAEQPAGAIEPTEHTNDSASSAWTASGAYATADDLATFFQAAVAGAVLSDETRAVWDEMDSLGYDQPDTVQFRFGLARDDGYLFYSGVTPGFNAVAAYNPDRDETVVVLANAMWTAGGNAPVAGIYETIRKALR